MGLPQDKHRINNMIEMVNLGPKEFLNRYLMFRPEYDIGKISGKEYWIRILQKDDELGDIKFRRLIGEDVQSWTQINKEMIQFISDARENVLNLSMISNMPRDHLEVIRDRFGWLNLFDELTFSCDVGINKPDPEIYEHCLDKIGIPSHECLFIDDSKPNIEGARKLGLNTIHFKSHAQMVEELEKYLLINKKP